MTPGPPNESFHSVLVTDFDGTMTQQDFYLLAINELLPPNEHDHWADYRAGKITHFEGLRRYFADIRKSEAEVLSVVARMEPDPQLRESVTKLRRAGWKVIVTSAGCDWYIRRLLGEAGLKIGEEIEVHANPGRFVEGEGLLMSMPTESPYWSPTLGVDKAGVVQRHLTEGYTVAFAGDGYPDADAARLVPDELRFARGNLEETLLKEGRPFHPFERWSEIADRLLTRGV